MTERNVLIRTKLPPRRRCVTVKAPLVFRAPGQEDAPETRHAFFVTVGFYPDGRPAEIFVKAARDLDSTIAHILDDVAVLISNLMQRGMSLRDAHAAIGRQRPGEIAASIIGALVQVAAEIPGEPSMESLSGLVNGRELLTPVSLNQARREILEAAHALLKVAS
jgi:hypothetical protein